MCRVECEDCISRSETIEWIENLRTLNKHYHPYSKDNHLIDCDSAIDHLKQVPSVLPKADKPSGEWISVTEDAPPKGTICLWCNKQGSVFTSEITYRSECSSYVGKHGYFSNGLENYGDIVAWMPLPSPFEPQKSEVEDGNK